MSSMGNITTILWIALAVLFVVFIITSVIISYHWNKYNIDHKAGRKMYFFYYGGTILFFIISASFILSL